MAQLTRSSTTARTGPALLALAFVWFALASPAAAHVDGKLELYPTDIVVRAAAGSSGVEVGTRLVDRDSGELASGFTVAARAVGAGDSVGPTALAEVSLARYEGLLAVSPGRWEIELRPDQGSSALPAVGVPRSVTVEVSADGVVEVLDTGSELDWALWVMVAAGAATALVLVYLAWGRRSAAMVAS